jgi:hypothetical protein
MNRVLGLTSLSCALLTGVVACGGIAQDIFSTRKQRVNDAATDGSSPMGDANGDVAPGGTKCVPADTTVELLRFAGDEISNLVVSGKRLFAYRAGINAEQPELVRFDLETKTQQPLARSPKSGSFGVDATGVFFLDDVPDAGRRVVRVAHDGSEPTDFAKAPTTDMPLDTIFAAKLEAGTAYVNELTWSYWAPGTPLGETLAQGGAGATVAVTAGPRGEPYYVLKHRSTSLSPDAEVVDLTVMNKLQGVPTTLEGDFSAMARAPGSVLLGTWQRPTGATIARVLDGQTTIASSLAVDDMPNRVEAIAATDDGMVWAQGETTLTAPPCTSGYGTYVVRTHTLPDGAGSPTAPTLVAEAVAGRHQTDCGPPAVAIDECNVYWVDGDRVMARAR